MRPEAFEEILDRWHEGQATPEDEAALTERLRDDADCRRAFVERAALEAELWELRAPCAAGRKRGWLGAAAALVLVSAAVFLALRGGERPPEEPLAGAPFEAPPEQPGRLRLADGSNVDLDPSGYAWIRGPVGECRQVVALMRGRARFRVERARGDFRVETPLGSVTALGTVFTVELRPAALLVAVEEGRVRVDAPAGSAALGAGEERLFSSPAAPLQAPVQARPAEDLKVQSRPPNLKGRTWALEARVGAAEGTQVRIPLRQVVERLHEGRLESTAFEWQPPPGVKRPEAFVRQGAFRLEVPVPPGRYQAVFKILHPAGAPSVRTMEFDAWDDEFVRELGPGLERLNGFVDEATRLGERFREASVGPEAWAAVEGALRRDVADFHERLLKARLERLYPAAAAELADVVENLNGVTKLGLEFQDGKLKGPKIYYPLNDPSGKGFDPANYARFARSVSSLAGRELGLWIVKDRRRCGALTAAAADVLRTGSAPFRERLLDAGADLAALERDLRGPDQK